MSGGAQRDAASVAAGVAAGGDAARSWRALHADLRPTGSSADTCAADLKKPSSWEPKPPPLPDADYKVILRIRGGLDCTKLHPCVLRQLVLKAVGLPISSPDQIRVNPTSHTVLVSTSSMDRADLYHNIRTLKFNGVPYEVVTHVADPVDSCRGRFHLPLDYADEEILPTLQRCNPAMTIGAARRLSTTETILVVFRGTHVPFYINYEGCTLRCRPFRLKVEACTRCRKIGHRQDVCPSTPDAICHKCGLKDSSMDHECEPVCVVCGGAHITGSPLCKQRYKIKTPKYQTPKPSEVPSSRTPSLNRSQERGPQRGRSKSKRRGPNSTPKELDFPTQSTNPHSTSHLPNPLKVSWAQAASSNCSLSQNISLEKVLAENASLKAEIQKLKLELQSRMPLSNLSQHSEPRSFIPAQSPPAVEPTIPLPPTDMDTTMPRDTSQLPPSNKRKTPATPREEESLSDTVLTLNDRINALENKTQKKFAVIESKISHIESRFTAQETGQAAINDKLDKFLDFVQTQMQQTTAWIAAVTANNPNIAVPAFSPTPPPDNGCKP
ncbi:uncharacterized protein LOC142817621 [Rhipicephalus microplus]|uniref:uncharacterized protein LOC142817621 n=1 Tax=Rhipicephalus microplus TaxID=6941 RepID=UPI003F6C1674